MSDVLTRNQENRSDDALRPGTRVEVRSRFDRSWARGFEVAALEDDGYRLRRLSDQTVLPAAFDPDDLRLERRRRSTGWL